MGKNSWKIQDSTAIFSTEIGQLLNQISVRSENKFQSVRRDGQDECTNGFGRKFPIQSARIEG